MPGSERSLLITDAYRDRLARLADRASTLTLQRWQQNVTLNRLEASHALWVTRPSPRSSRRSAPA
jgi:hypothetical protein